MLYRDKLLKSSGNAAAPRDIDRAWIDFTREDMFLEFGLTFTIRIGQILGTGFGIALGALKIFLRSKKRVKREEKEEAEALKNWLKEHPEDAAAVEIAVNNQMSAAS